METQGSGAKARHHGQLGRIGGGSLSSPFLEANLKRAADPGHDLRRRDGDAGAQGEGQASQLGIAHVGVFIRQACGHLAALLRIPGEPKQEMGTDLP